jgi:hypothetical protein
MTAAAIAESWSKVRGQRGAGSASQKTARISVIGTSPRISSFSKLLARQFLQELAQDRP